jgi:CHAD domain-containing protein
MSGSKTISELYTGHQHSFLKHLRTAQNLSEEKVHQLRVEIKRLRSFFRLLKVLTEKGGKAKKVLKLLDPVFKTAGRVRNATLNRKLLKPLKSRAALEFKRYLQEKEKKNVAELKRKIRKFRLKKISKLGHSTVNAFKAIDRQAVDAKAGKYVRELLRDIHAAIPDISEDKTFHGIRKKLKDVKTVDQLLLEIAPEHVIHRAVHKIRGVDEKIGDWHDHVVLVEEIEKYLKKHEGRSGEKLAELALLIQARNEEYKREIARELKLAAAGS